MQDNTLPSSLELDQNRVTELVGNYHAAVDWGQAHKEAEAEINEEYDAKLTDARIAGYPSKRIDGINSSRQIELDDSHKVKKYKSLAETMPKPTYEQKEMAAAALEELMAMCEEFVVMVVQEQIKLTASTANYDDALNVGRMGLIKSLLNYDPAKGPLTTYALPFIQRAVADYGIESIGSAAYYQSMVARYGAAIKKLISEGNTSPSIADIAVEIGIGLEALQKLVNFMNRGDSFRPDGGSSPTIA